MKLLLIIWIPMSVIVCTCAVRNCLEARLHSVIPPPELLVQLRHQRLLYPPNQYRSASLLRNISFQPVAGTADLADSPYASSASSSASSTSAPPDTTADGLANFKFFAPLRHKLDLIQRMAAVATATDTAPHRRSPEQQQQQIVPPTRQSQGPEVECYLAMIQQLAPSIQTLIFGIRPVLVHYPGDYFVSWLLIILSNFLNALKELEFLLIFCRHFYTMEFKFIGWQPHDKTGMVSLEVQICGFWDQQFY